MKNNLFIISNYGWGYVAAATVLTIVFSLLDCSFLAFISLLVTFVFLYLFRNPERELSIFDKNSILSPVDGVVSKISELDDPEYSYRVDIASSYLDISILRIPMSSKVESLQVRHGTRVSLKSKLFKDLNEQCEVVFVDEKGHRMKIVHTLTECFVPLMIDIIKSQPVHQTVRYGYMGKGVTSLYLPHNVRLNINLANELKASESLLGYFS